MPEVFTILRVDVEPDDVAPVRQLLAAAEGTVADPEVVTGSGAGTVAVVAGFRLAGDATTTAVRVAAARRGGRPPRLVLSTGEVERSAARLDGPARQRVDALAAHDGDAQVRLTASTAVMITHALPPGVELVDLGTIALAPQGDERVYSLRPVTVRPVDDDAGASSLGWAHRAAARLVVGRGGHIARVEQAWAHALEGANRVVVLSGDPGIGKTTVAAELALRVHAGGGTVLYGRWDEEGHAPYQAVREALGTYAASCPRRLLRQDVAAHADELARLLPDIGTRIGGVRPPLAHDPDAERLRLFDAVRDWLGAIAGRRPVLLVLDDLQWAERSSLLLLRHLLDEPPDGPLLIVVTLRDGEVEGQGPLHTLGWFESSAEVDRVEIAGLAQDDVTELVGQTLGRPVLGHDETTAAQWLTEETAGNPLFVHEVLRGLDPDDPAGALLQARERLPERVHDVVRWRLAGLSPQVHELLAVASFVGEEFSLDVLAASVDGRVLELRHQLDDAVRAGVIRDTDDSGRLAFAHALVRRALQDDVDPQRATGLHRRIAGALADAPAGVASPAQIAHHHLRAADTETAADAIRWGRAAADQARRETAFEGAVWFLSQAVEVHDRFGMDAAPTDRARALACELRLDLAEAHDRAGEFIARDRRHLEAADLARSLGRTDLFTRAALGYGGRLPAAPPPSPTARQLLDELLRRLSPTDGRARALTLARLAHVLHADATHEERKAIADEAEAMARRLDTPLVLASVLGSRVLALDGPDDVDEHLDIGAEIMRIGDQTGDTDIVLQGARARIHPLFVVGAHDAARDLATRFTDLAGTVRHPDHLRLVAMWQTMWATLEGRLDEAEAQSDQLRVRLEVAGHSQVGTIHFVQSFVTRWMRGTLAAARPVVEAGRHHNADSFTWWVLQAWVEAASGDHDAARALLADRPVDEMSSADAGYLWTFAVVGAAVTAATVGDARWAQATHETLAPYSGRNCVLGYVAYLGAVDHHLGTLDAVLGRHDEAVEHLEAALERHRVIAARPWIALTAAWLGHVLSDRAGPGDAEQAGVLRAEATALVDELGLAGLPPPHTALGA